MKNKQKFMMICDFFDASLGYHEAVISKILKDNNYDVVIITSQYKDHFQHISNYPLKKEVKYKELVDSILIYRLPYLFNMKGLFKMFDYRELKSLVSEHDPDFVFVHGVGFDALSVSLIARGKRESRFKFFVDFHGDRINSAKNRLSLYLQHRIINRLILNFCKPYVDKVFAVSKTSFYFIKESFNISESLLYILPLVPDYQQIFRSISNSKESTCSKFGIKTDKKLIFWGGKITRNKLLEVLLSAVERLDDFQLVLVGRCTDQSYIEEINHFIDRLGSKVVNLGWLDQTDVYEIQSITDFAVFPTSQSVVWQQSLVLGNQVICGDRQLSRDGRLHVTIELDYLGMNDDIHQFNPYKDGVSSLISILQLEAIRELKSKPLKLKEIKTRIQRSKLSPESLLDIIVS